MTDKTPSGLPQPQTVAAIKEALALLGPEAPECCGCEYEWNQAVQVLRAALSAPAVETVAVQEAKKGKYAGMTNMSYLKNKPQDLLDYEALCDIWAEANAVDTVLGDRYRLMSKIAKLRDDMGSRRPAPLPVAPKAAEPTCPYCTNDNPAVRDLYFDQNCAGCVRRMTTPQADSAQPVADRSAEALKEALALADSEGSRAVKYLRVIRKVRAVVDEWPEVDIPGSPLSRIRTIVAFAGAAMGTPQQAEGRDHG